jgi:hypothetical protein
MWAFGGYLRFKPNLGMVVRACNPSTWGTKAGRWQIQSQPGLCNKTPSQKKNTIIQGGDSVHIYFV